MISFDRILGELLRICEGAPGWTDIAKASVIRDPRGCVRLVLEPAPQLSSAALAELRSHLEADLSALLERFFATPILATTDALEAGRVARALLSKSPPWIDAEYEDRGTGATVQPLADRWHLLERRVTKQGWLDSKPTEPLWPLVARTPIVAFYSFKGGVGRTTALLSAALQLAGRGSRVAMVDLDLEAPGLGPLFDVQTERGVLDAIVDHIATGQVNLAGLFVSPTVLGAEVAERIDVFPAGQLNQHFLEKLARLDYSTVGPWGGEETIPVHKALRALLKLIRAERKPNYILLDARAGLHDLAGLSLHGLAHVDVLVTRASEQAYQGLDLTVRALAHRKPEEQRLVVTVHAFAPADPSSPEGIAEIDEFRTRSYDIFSTHIYDNANAPAENHQEAAHWPWQLKRRPALDRFTSIASVVDELYTNQHRELLDRIIALGTPEEEEAE